MNLSLYEGDEELEGLEKKSCGDLGNVEWVVLGFEFDAKLKPLLP